MGGTGRPVSYNLKGGYKHGLGYVKSNEEAFWGRREVFLSSDRSWIFSGAYAMSGKAGGNYKTAS